MDYTHSTQQKQLAIRRLAAFADDFDQISVYDVAHVAKCADEVADRLIEQAPIEISEGLLALEDGYDFYLMCLGARLNQMG